MESAHESREVDLTAAGRGVWLIKVPKYLSEKWEKASGSCEVGKLRIAQPQFPNQKTKVMYTLNEQLAKPDPGSVNTTPREHNFVLTGISSQNLSVISHTPCPPNPDNPMEKPADNLAFEGKVTQRAECKPILTDNYMKLKKLQMEIQNKPKREVKQLDTHVVNYKPIKIHAFNLQHEQRKKEEGKRSRMDKDQLTDILYAAFEEHQYYNVKDLVNLTKQPLPYLKEILKEICVYNMKAPHRNMWELKPEYRHYKTDEKT